MPFDTAVKRVLVTGADGFIGAALCSRLAKGGVDVIPMIHRPGPPNAIVTDLGSEPIPSLLGTGVDVVFHLAARVHQFDDGAGAEGEHQRVTVDGTRALLVAAAEAGVKSLVFFSTCAIMPVGIDNALDERVEARPTTAYGRAKLAAEKLVLSMNGAGELSTVCLRLPTVYGRGHKGQLKRMIDAIKKRVFPPIPDLGGARSFVHVDDVVSAATLVATSPAAFGNVFIVAEERAYTSRQIYDIVMGLLGRRPPRWRVPRVVLKAGAKAGDMAEAVLHRRAPFDSEMLEKLSQPARYSSALIREELGFTPQRALPEAVGELVTLGDR